MRGESPRFGVNEQRGFAARISPLNQMWVTLGCGVTSLLRFCCSFRVTDSTGGNANTTEINK